MTDLCLIGATAILGDRLREDARVVVQDGQIVEVGSRGASAPGAINATGLLVMPGLIDVHSDGLEREAQPRPNVELDTDLALSAFEGRVRSAGIMTVFHGVAFEENRTWSRSLAMAERSYRAIDNRAGEEGATIDHKVLHRLDARDGPALAALGHRLPEGKPLVSFEDHTPGQGQFSDVNNLRKLMVQMGASEQEAAQRVEAQISEREVVAAQYELSLRRLSEWALSGRIRLLTHDPTHAEQIDRFGELGASVAEFPCTVEAAEAAREWEMPIVLGAPNIVLGGSHSGNVDAAELVARGLCDAIASDYAPHTLLAAAFLLARRGLATLPQAIGLVTSGAALAAGLSDRGALVPGLRGDLVVVDDTGRWPRVVASWRAGERRVEQARTPVLA